MPEITVKCEGRWTYDDALAVISDLKKAGFDCGVSTGSVWVFLDAGQQERVSGIVGKHGGKFCLFSVSQLFTCPQSETSYYNSKSADELQDAHDQIQSLNEMLEYKAPLTSQEIAEIDEYFNGDKTP